MEAIAIIGSVIGILKIFKIHLLVIIVNHCSFIQGIEVKKGEILITRTNGTKKHKNISPIKISSNLLLNKKKGSG